MSLYRASPEDGVAWVTGGSTGIGRQVALGLARQGYVVAVTARDDDRLQSLAEEAAEAPGRVVPYLCDVTDEAGMAETVAAIERDHGPIALALFNAGNYFPTRGERLDVLNFVRTFEVNVFGVINGLVPVAELMRLRGHGHIALVGSVSAYFGWPSTAAYGGAKAALNNMAQSLRFDFDKLNIRIQMFNPGFVDTPLTRKNKFAMPALMPVDRAAARIVSGLRTGGYEVTFPRRFTWFLKALALLPQPVVHAFVNRATGWNKRPISTGR